MGTDQKIAVTHLISGDLWAGAEAQAYFILKNLQKVEHLRLSAILLNRGKLSEKLEEIGLEVHVVDESKLGFLKIGRHCEDIVVELKADIVHSHRYKENIIAALIKRNGRVSHLVQTVHGMSEPFSGLKAIKGWLYEQLNAALTKRCFARVLTVSDEIRDTIVGRLPKEMTETVHNAIDSDSIRSTRSPGDVRAEFGIPTGCSLIGSAGRMVNVKNFDLFLESAVRIHKSNPNTRFLLVGDGPELERLKAGASAMKMDGVVQFTGFRQDVHEIIAAMDIFLITSTHEGIPMVALETMTLGTPLVSTAVGGMPEIIEDGMSGLLAASGDAGDIAQKCLSILENDDIRSSLTEGAGRVVRSKFGPARQTDRICKIYSEVMKQL